MKQKEEAKVKDEKEAAATGGAEAQAGKPKTPETETQAGKPEASEAETQVDASQTLKKELDETKKKLKETEASLAEQKDVLMRTAAEYDNYRKRTTREKQTAYADATADTIKEILSVADNLERALAQKECSVEDLRKGVEMTHKQMQSALQKLGVSEIGKEGDTFDPNLHSAVAHIEDESLGENVIAQVYQKGYRIGDKIVRHAMVQTAN